MGRSSAGDVWIFSLAASACSLFSPPAPGPVALASVHGSQWASMPLTPAGLAQGGTSSWRIGGE